MINNNSLVCYIPTSLNIQELEGYNKRWHDKYHWFIHSIVFKGLTNKNNFGEYATLNGAILQKYIGTRYLKDVIRTLEENKVIEIYKHFIVGGKSKGYRLSKAYRNSTIKEAQIIKSTYERKIKSIRENYLKDVLSNDTIKAEFRNLTYARIDKEKALEYINSTYDNRSKQYKSRLIAIEQYDAMQYANFTNGRYDINFTFKVHSGRVYSPATMLARDLEKFTYFVGHEEQDSAVLDMPNSQLCFYSHLTKKTQNSKIQPIEDKEVNTNCDIIGSIYGRYIVDSRNTPELNHDSAKKKQKNLTPLATPPPYDMTITPNGLNIKTWEALIFSSKGYEAMMSLSKWKGKVDQHTPEERQEFKAEFFGNLFYNKYQPKLTHLEGVFKQYFPNEFKALREAKYKYGNKLLAVKVQSLEAQFFHKIIVNHMRRNYKGVPYVIKHDSIKLPIEYAEAVHEELNVLARAFFGRNDIKLKFENV